MTQPILINTNNVQASVNSAAPRATINSDPSRSHQDKTQAGQAFSSELEKHIDKPQAAPVKVASDVKKTDADNDKDAVKSEDAVDKDGNSLPEENTVAEPVDAHITQELGNDADDTVAEVFELTEPDVELSNSIAPMLNASEQNVKSTDVLELTESDLAKSGDSVEPVLNASDNNVENINDVDPDFIPKGVLQTDAIHAVVHGIKHTVEEQKQINEETQQKSTIGQLISDNVKNMTKPNADGLEATHSVQVENVVQTKVVATQATVEKEITPKLKSDVLQALSGRSDGKERDLGETITTETSIDKSAVQTKVATTQSTLEKESTSKLRPDILQALSLRSSDGKEPALATGEDAKTEAIIDKGVASFKSHNGQLLVPELVERLTSKTAATQSNSASDKTLLGAFSMSGNQTTLSGVNVKSDGPVFDIQPSLQSAAWNRVMTSRVLWMAREGVQQASLKLNPANLGPVEVRLNMNNDQANVTFIAQSAVTRDALEQALPRLRESFAQNGLELTNANVSQQSFGQSGDNNQEEAGLMSGAKQHNSSHASDVNSDQEQKIVDNDTDVELGLSIYA